MPGLFHAADSGLIEALVVTEGRRGEGIGRLLRTGRHRGARAGRVRRDLVSTGAGNEVAQRLYFELGLTEASVLMEKHVES